MVAARLLCTAISVLAWLQIANSQMFELSPMDMMQLTSAVRQIVHPQAQPTMPMMAIATRHGSPPATMAQMFEYTPHFVDLANRMGVRPPGVNGTVTPQMLREYMIAQGTNWMQQQGALSGMSGGQMGLGTEMTGLGGMMGLTGMGMTGGPSMRQPMTALGGGGMGMGFSPMAMMLNFGIEHPVMDMDLFNPSMGMGNPSMGMGNPLNMMYLMESMA